MADYKYGVYGMIGNDIAQNASQTGTAPVYFGTAPVNLLTDFSGRVNVPVKLSNLSDAQKKIGHVSDPAKWSKYTLCEAVAAHFANANGNVGPIYVINVLDPTKHKKATVTKETLTFANGRAVIADADTVILNTFAIEDKVLGTDYTLTYDYGTRELTITDIGQTKMTTVEASYSEIDPAAVKEEDIIGGTDSAGNVKGIGALKLVYQTNNIIPTYLAAPGWSDKKAVYNALVAASQNINGHWSAFVFADLPIDSVQTIEAAKSWKLANAYTSGFSKVFWPQFKDGDAIYHLATLALVEKLRCDMNNGDVPFETCGNKSIPGTGLYLGEGASYGFDKTEANNLTAAGITTAIFWEGNWRIWGDHTAAYTYGGGHKAREIFDVNMIMLFYIVNGFQKEWGTTIDKPMTIALRDTILNREQEKLDSLVARGALIGNPTVEFLESNNETTDLMNGDFRWDIAATITPPLKSATAVVCYTDAGFSAYFGGED